MFNIKDTCYIFPVRDKQNKIHGICCISIKSHNFNIVSDLEILKKFGILLTMGILSEKKLLSLENKRKELYNNSIKDSLTGIFNRRYLDIFIKNEVERSKRFQHPLSVIMSDIDHFKNINDTYTHNAGDIVLKKIAHIIKKNVRSIDIFIRYGGDELLLILPNTNKQGAYNIAKKLIKAIDDTEIKYESRIIKCTISAGIASIEEASYNINELIFIADKRLYKAKESGRNRASDD